MYEINMNLSILSINAFVSKKTQEYKLFNATVVFWNNKYYLTLYKYY